MNQLAPADVAALLASDDAPLLIDVREQNEWDYCHLPGARLCPLSEWMEHESELLELDRHLVIYCHHGVRSAQACARLASQGASKVTNLAGGIDRWSVEVDARIPRY